MGKLFPAFFMKKRDKLSWFLLLLLLPRQILLKLASGHAHLPAIIFLHRDSFLAPGQLGPRHCASTHFVTFVTT